MVLLSKIGEIVMEQLQKDRNYTGFLIRLIDKEIKANKFKSKNELINFINKIKADLNTNEVRNYIVNNALIFDGRIFEEAINKMLMEFDRVNQVQNIIPLVPNQIQTPTTTYNNTPVQNVNSNNVVDMRAYQSSVNNVNIQEQYVPITKVDANRVSKEIIEKINFLIVNPKVDVNDFAVNIVNGDFKNIKDNMIYIVRKNITNGAFELVNKNDTNKVQVSNNNVNRLSSFSNEDLTNIANNPNVSDDYKKLSNEELNNRKEKTKTRKLIMPKINNAAFVSTVLLTVVSAISGIVIAAILLSR